MCNTYRTLLLTFLVCLFGFKIIAATFVVTNAADSGAGSLRSAITNANYYPGLDTITFNIAGAGVHTINLVSALPTLTEPAMINGATQPGYAGAPLIELNGASAGASPGLRLVAAASGSTIRALALNRFGSHGIQVDGGSSNALLANFIGTDASGTAARGNSLEGIYLNGSSGNTVGGLAAAERNLISANGDAGIYILNGFSNTVLGNYIGTTLAANAALGNGNNGITVYSAPGLAASGNRVGRAGGRNIISGNRASGIYLSGSGVTGSVLQANYIGVNSSGTAGLSNLADGISLQGAVGNLIGGTNDGDANVISANGKAGISLTSATNNAIAGNFIGTDAAGRLGLGNSYAGITLAAARNNTIGGAGISARNIIAANLQDGIFLTTNASGNVVAGNLIGVSAAGNSLANLYNGISINAASSNTIGGAAVAERNIISGNANYGVELFGGSGGNQIIGNFIGPMPNGSAAMPNNSAGIFITAASANVICGNILSGNNDAGMYIVGRTAARNTIQGNKIGTDVSGNNALPNILEGIYIEAASSNTIGGPVPGTGNLISGNSTRGVYLTNAPWTVIQGNLVGTRVDGLSPLPNGVHNLECESGTTNVLISANTSAFAPGVYCGVRIRPGAVNNRILGNSIFGNGALGIDLGVAGATLNDHCDSDTGANLQQNFPVVTQAVSGVVTGIRGTLDASAGSAFLLQFFANPANDASGYGEGQIYLGDASVITSGSCMTSFLVKLPVSLPPGYAITATATDPAGNTSEFSSGVVVAGVPRLSLGLSNRLATLSWANNPGGFVLKQTSTLAPPVNWTTVTNIPSNVGGMFSVTLPLGQAKRFFLLSFE